jgi:glycosyltransferase involved in cell wall biosynthesis
MFKPKVSILMTVFNSESRFQQYTNRVLLNQAIDSLLNQSYQEFELVILDNLSSDKTFEICEFYAQKDTRVRVIRDSRRTNTEEALGKLLNYSAGDLVMFANDDDIWDRDFLKTLVISHQENPEVECHFSNAFSIDLKGKPSHRITKSQNETIYFEGTVPVERFTGYFIRRNPLPKIFGLHKRSAMEKVFPLKTFDDLGADMDNLLFLKFYALGFRCKFLDLPLFSYRARPRPIGAYSGRPTISEHEAGLEINKYLNHQIDFYIVSCKLASEHFSEKEYLFFLTYSFEGFVKHTLEKLIWLKNDYAPTVLIKESLEETISLLRGVLHKMPSRFSDYNFSPNQGETQNLVFLESFLFESLRKYVNECLKSLGDAFNFLSLKLDIENFTTKYGGLTSRFDQNSEVTSAQNGERAFSESESINSEISILVTSMNLSRFVSPTLKSISDQGGVALEILVADGGSTDSSLIEISKFAEAEIVSLQDRGYVDGINLALEQAKSPYVAQCCISDSYANQNWLYESTRFLNANPEISLVWGFPRYMSENGLFGALSYDKFLMVQTPIGSEMYFYWLSHGFFFPEGNFVCRREVFRECFITQSDFESNPVEPYLEFTARFHEKGFLSSHIPTIANYGRSHEDQSGSLLSKSGEMNNFRKKYRRRILREKYRLLLHRKKVFLDFNGTFVKEETISFQKSARVLFNESRYFFGGVLNFVKSRTPVTVKTKMRILVFQLTNKT